MYVGVASEGRGEAPAARPRMAPEHDREVEPAPLPAAQREEGPSGWTGQIQIPATLAHVYSECARIWNPIHTDRAVARGAGLPDIILHGTATLALAVSEVLRREAIAPGGVRRVACRFGAMVHLPGRLTLDADAHDDEEGRRIRFRAVTADGTPALRNGALLSTAHERTTR
jgi:acyl dehydratase